MGQADHERVVSEMRLEAGPLFPIPITFPVQHGDNIAIGKQIALRNANNNLLAVMTVEEIYPWDRRRSPGMSSVQSTCVIHW